MSQSATPYRLCFRSLFQRGRGYAFPCDRAGRVDVDALGQRARESYFQAQALVGRELSAPCVEMPRPPDGRPD